MSMNIYYNIIFPTQLHTSFNSCAFFIYNILPLLILLLLSSSSSVSAVFNDLSTEVGVFAFPFIFMNAYL